MVYFGYILYIMKKFLLIALLFTGISSFAYAADIWDDFSSSMDNAWDGQKPITNKEFEEAIDTLQGKQKQQEAKQRTKKIKKIGGGGTSLHSDLNPESEIKSLTPLKKNEDGMLLNIPVNMIIDEVILDKGYYNVFAEKDKNGDIYLSFYQSQYFKGKVRACKTDSDFDEETIDFVKLLPYDKNFVKIIYGSLDFNAYAYIRYIADLEN